MPYALATGHVPGAGEAGVADVFNSDSIGFMTADVLNGDRPFIDVWEHYHAWSDSPLMPDITMVESSPHDQIAYGYGYRPLGNISASMLEFARDYFPYVRFGLALTLMNDGYFAHELGDTWHGNVWWYDELDYALGNPLGEYIRVSLGTSRENLLINGSFEDPIANEWELSVNTEFGAEATLTREETGVAVGFASAHVQIANSGNNTDWHVTFRQDDRPLTGGITYDLHFQAKADRERSIITSVQKGSPDWRNYGLWKEVAINTQWREYSVAFEASETSTDARIQFFCGSDVGDVWLDDVQLVEHPPDVFRRDFERGVVVLNGTHEPVTVPLEAGLSRLQGDQAPRHQYILDDTPDIFSFNGDWQEFEIDSGGLKSSGPFYHDWGAYCHLLQAGAAGTAQWDLQLRVDDTYTIQTWWSASTDAGTWSSQVVYEVIAGGDVVASAILNQRTGGDEWHTIGVVELNTGSSPYIRIRNEGSGTCIADASHVMSASRYNDGSISESVRLEPLDGIILQRAARNQASWSSLYYR
jgi:hypothetical protein